MLQGSFRWGASLCQPWQTANTSPGAARVAPKRRRHHNPGERTVRTAFPMRNHWVMIPFNIRLCRGVMGELFDRWPNLKVAGAYLPFEIDVLACRARN
jgi:hypothetical protein